jgi:HEAT repeat protein
VEVIWRLLPDVRARERSRFLFFAGLFTLVSLAQTVGLAGSEALFLAEFGAAQLAPTFIAAAAVTVLASLVYAVRVGAERNDRLFFRMLFGAGLLLLLATAALLAGRTVLLPVLFCAWYATQAIFLNHFWTFSGDYFDTLSSKRLVPLFTIGASAGGVLGGALAALLASLAGPVSLVAAWGLGLCAAGGLLVAAHRPLRRWGPLELEEADETSVEGMRGALLYLGRSSLARWLLVSAIGMVLALFLAQYLYSDIFARRFPDPAQLATFLSVYFAVTNLLEILLELTVTPWLIRRLGVPGANLLHPVTMALSFAGLGLPPGLPAALGARVSRELLDNAAAAPIRALLYSPMPPRFRGRVRAFMEGIVVYAGMGLAGVVLLGVRDLDVRWLAGAGAGAAVLYLLANWKVRVAYLGTLVRQLQAGRLDLTDVSGAIGGWEATRLAALWEAALAEGGRHPDESLLQLIPALARRGIVDPLVRAASHPSAEVRRASIDALSSLGGTAQAGPLALALDDPEPRVRLAALRGLGRAPDESAFLASRLADLLEDPDPVVRAEAARRAGPPGLARLEAMVGSADARIAEAGLAAAPVELLPRVVERAREDGGPVRARALEAAASLASDPCFETDELLRLARDPDPRVRRSAVLLLANSDEPAALPALAERLTDPASEVQLTAERVLVALGEEGLAAVTPHLRSDVEAAAEAALRVAAAGENRRAQALLTRELRHLVRDLWYHLAAYQHLPEDGRLGARFLRVAFSDAMMRDRRLAFRTLELLENPGVIRKVERELRSGGSRSRGDALEVLSNLGDRESARLLVLVHEAGALDDRLRSLAGLVSVPSDARELVARARESEHRWIRLGARALDPREDDLAPQEDDMQKLLALKRVELFANLSLEQLDALQQVTREAEYMPGEVVCREGERGETLFLLLEGSVSVVKNHGEPGAVELAALTAVDYFGEMAILEDAPRSATVIAVTPIRVSSLDGTSLKDLILQMPEISFEIFRVLCARLRHSEARLKGS